MENVIKVFDLADEMYEGEVEILSPLHLRFTINDCENELYGDTTICNLQFNGGYFQMIYGYHEYEGEEFRSLLLFKKCGNRRHPIDAFVQVESGGRGRIVTDLSEHTHFADMGKYWMKFLWRRQGDEIQHAVPDFRNHALTWIIVLKAGILQAASVDSQTKCSMPEGFEISCMESLSADFAQLMVRGSDPDMAFMCAGQSIGAHGEVVCARSSVIAAMLSSDMPEGRTKVITIRGVEPDVFKHFLRYLYCGKLEELTCDFAVTLYKLGDQYDVLGLVKRCSQFLLEHLSPENACDILVIADLHSDEDFAEKIITYIVSAFRKNHPKLALKVLREKELVQEKKRRCRRRKFSFRLKQVRKRKK